MSPQDYCLEGGTHWWEATGVECDCGDGMCRLECTECGAKDYYCEDN